MAWLWPVGCWSSYLSQFFSSMLLVLPCLVMSCLCLCLSHRIIDPGAMNGLRANSPLLITCLCGMMTCTFGCLTRDTLLNRPVRILHPYSDAYASIAFGGAGGYLALRALAPAYQGVRIGATVLGVVMARKVTWENGYRLPYWGAVTKGSSSSLSVSTASSSTTTITTIIPGRQLTERKYTVTYDATSDPRTTTK